MSMNRREFSIASVAALGAVGASFSKLVVKVS
jgi:hypothetical protein